MSVRLSAQGLSAGYNGMPAIRDVTLEVRPGQMVLLAGANGAGKTTTVMTLAGRIPPISGTVSIDGQPVETPLHKRAKDGLGLITEKRSVFMGLTVRENLRLGQGSPELAFQHFPELERRVGVKAGLLSGGEQQMLSLARIIAARPRIILADELSLGLAPIVVKRLLAELRSQANQGCSVLLVEQHVKVALDVVDRAYFLQRGAIAFSGKAAAIKQNPDRLKQVYL